jgi:hypothetical protein
MPSVSKKQHNLMEAVAHNKAFAKKVGIPQSVGQDFAKADKGKTFRKGGDAMAIKKKMAVNPAMAMMAARAMRTPAPVQAAPMGGAPMGGMPGAMPGMKKGGSAMKKMAKGGSADPKSMKYDVEAGSNKHGKFGESKVQKSGKTRGMNLGDTGPKEKIESEKNMKFFMKKYAEGGSIKASKMGSVKTSGGHKPHGDGIAERGKTRAMMPKMKGRTI